MGGTSFSCPGAAGSAALIREYFARGFYPTGDSNTANEWNYISAALVKACLLNGASPQLIGYTVPDNNIGWGRVLLDDVLYFYGDIRKLTVVDETTGVATGEYQEYVVSVNNQSEPLKTALVWTDYPGVAGANPAIVNNLDLEVIAPDGTHYRGNQYTSGQSTPNPTLWDTLNVEECCRVNVPVLGDWTIRVYGTNVPQGTRQPYALAISGGLGLQSEPVLHICGYKIQGNNSAVDPGDTLYITDTLLNSSGLGVTGCSGILRTQSPYIFLIDSIGNFGDILVGWKGNNGGSKFRFRISFSTPFPIYVPFVLHLSGASGYNQDISFDLRLGNNGLEIIWGPKQVQIAPGDSQFLYGLTYNPTDSRIYVANFYSRHIYLYTSDSNVTYLGSIPAPDSACTDLKYCAYDNTFWVAANPTQTAAKKIVKINPSGTILREFSNPANDYPTGLAWMGTRRRLFLADRRTAPDSLPQYIYSSDTLGGADQMILSFDGHYGPRCLAMDPIDPYYGSLDTNLLLTYTWFNNTGTSLDSVSLYELRLIDLGVVNRLTFPGWNVRGIEYDPRDYNYWITIPQNPDRSIAKIAGFHQMVAGVRDETNAYNGSKLYLAPPCPNPFTRRLTISYVVPYSMRVKIKLYDIAGRLVATLADGVENAGSKTVSWDGRDEHKNRLPAGVYFLRLETGQGSLTRKIVLTR